MCTTHTGQVLLLTSHLLPVFPSVFFYFTTKILAVYIMKVSAMRGHVVAQLVKALRYKTEGRGFDSDGVVGIFY
jgi:hypothetical protein